MNHLFTQGRPSDADSLPNVSNMNVVGDDGNATSFPTSKLGTRRSPMKKMIHIAAVPVLAVLLSACATPGGQNLAAPGGLSQVQKDEVKAVAEDVLKGPGGLNAVVNALTPGNDGLDSKVKQALNTAVELVLSGQTKDSTFIRRKTFKFDLSKVPPTPRKIVKEELSRIFGNPPSKKVGSELEFRKGIYLSTDEDDKVGYVVENLAGLTGPDKDVVDWIEGQIRNIPSLHGKDSVSIRLDPSQPKAEIPIHQTLEYVGIAGGIKAADRCKIEITMDLAGVDTTLKDFAVLTREGEEPTGFRTTQANVARYSFTVNGEMKDQATGLRRVCAMLPLSTDDFHYVMVTPKTGRIVAQYISVHLREGSAEEIPVSAFTEEKPACPPSQWPDIVEERFEEELRNRNRIGCER